tara:strand:- start:595 stop:903 length:309 start_codon:yes stop_codon:yes gene_type:complete
MGATEEPKNRMTLREDIEFTAYFIVYYFTIPRILYFFVDPFFSKHTMPEILVALLYGNAYPSIDAQIALLVFTLVLMLMSTQSMDEYVENLTKQKEYVKERE